MPDSTIPADPVGVAQWPQSDARCLIPIDGLALSGAKPFQLRVGRLVQLSIAEWREFLRPWHDSVVPDLGLLADLWALEIVNSTDERLPPNIALEGEPEPPAQTVRRIARDEILAMNLWAVGSVRPVGLYGREPHGELLGLTIAPPRARHNVQLADDGDVIESSETVACVGIGRADRAAFRALLDELAECRAAIAAEPAESPRVEFAIRYFERMTRTEFDWNPAPENSVLTGWLEHAEDIVVDACTALEALFLWPREKNKASLIGERAGSLLASDQHEVGRLSAHLKCSYDTRNGIIHADRSGCPPARVAWAASRLRIWLRQALVAVLRLRGARNRLKTLDPTVAAANRALVPRYETSLDPDEGPIVG